MDGEVSTNNSLCFQTYEIVCHPPPLIPPQAGGHWALMHNDTQDVGTQQVCNADAWDIHL